MLQEGRAALTTGHISARLPPLQPAGVELTQPEHVIAFQASQAPDAVGPRWVAMGSKSPQQRHRVVALHGTIEAPVCRLATSSGEKGRPAHHVVGLWARGDSQSGR